MTKFPAKISVHANNNQGQISF